MKTFEKQPDFWSGESITLPRPEPDIQVTAGYEQSFMEQGIIRPLQVKLFNPPHLAIIGNSGSGKTYELTRIAGHLALDGLQSGIEMIFADFKGIDFQYLNGQARFYQHFEVSNALDLVYQEMDARMQGSSNNNRPLVLCFDEWSSFVGMLDKKDRESAIQKLSSILALGRGVSIAVVLGLQRPDATVFGRCRDNIGNFIALGTLSTEAKRMVSPDNYDKIKPQARGRGYLITDGKPLQTLVVPEIQNMEKLHGVLREYLSG